MATSFDRTALYGERVRRRAAAPSAAADQDYLDQVAAGSVDIGYGHVGQGRSGSQFAGGFNESTTASQSLFGKVPWP